jgi:hypothetical protein
MAERISSSSIISTDTVRDAVARVPVAVAVTITFVRGVTVVGVPVRVVEDPEDAERLNPVPSRPDADHWMDFLDSALAVKVIGDG